MEPQNLFHKNTIQAINIHNQAPPRKPPQSKDVPVNSRFEPDLADEVADFIMEKGDISRSELVRVAVKEYMRQDPFRDEINQLISWLQCYHEKGRMSVT